MSSILLLDVQSNVIVNLSSCWLYAGSHIMCVHALVKTDEVLSRHVTKLLSAASQHCKQPLIKKLQEASVKEASSNLSSLE